MDPSSFTKTSFCSTEIDNITTNESKQYILNSLSLLCSNIKYNSRYAKVFNEQFSKNLNNPHVFYLKSSGTPYLLFLTQINSINYAFFIDKKVKEGYSYPKIFILPYEFSPDLYKCSLFECELIRKRNKKWCIGVNDIYYYCGKNMKKTSIIDRMNTIHQVFNTKYTSSEFSNTCPPFVKKYFDYKDVSYVFNDFIPNLDYETRGIYFVPMRVDYSNILYIFKEKDSVKLVEKPKKTTKCFRIMKTMKPDVYELYGLKSDILTKIGIALVQTTLLSHSILSWFQDKDFDSEVLVECKYNEYFKKWEPISLSDECVDEI